MNPPERLTQKRVCRPSDHFEETALNDHTVHVLKNTLACCLPGLGYSRAILTSWKRREKNCYSWSRSVRGEHVVTSRVRETKHSRKITSKTHSSARRPFGNGNALHEAQHTPSEPRGVWTFATQQYLNVRQANDNPWMLSYAGGVCSPSATSISAPIEPARNRDYTFCNANMLIATTKRHFFKIPLSDSWIQIYAYYVCQTRHMTRANKTTTSTQVFLHRILQAISASSNKSIYTVEQ